jgi:hypothetical protein
MAIRSVAAVVGEHASVFVFRLTQAHSSHCLVCRLCLSSHALKRFLGYKLGWILRFDVNGAPHDLLNFITR